MDWTKILAAVFLVMMIVFLLPRANQMIKNTPKGNSKDWQAAIIPLVLVVLFIVFLVQMV